MPKVPGADYVASQGVPGSAPFENASGTALAAPALVAERGFAATEAQSEALLRQVQAVNAEEERQRQRDAVVKGSADALEKLNQSETELQLGRQNPDGSVASPPATSEDYYTKWKDNTTKIREDATSGIQDPAVARALDTALTHLFATRSTQAWHYSKNLFVQEQGAEADSQADQALRLYLAAKDPEEAQQALTRYEIWLSNKQGVFGPQGVQQRQAKFNEKVLVTQAARLSTTSEGRQQLIEMDNAGAFDDVDPTRRAQIMGRIAAAETRAENAGRQDEVAIKAQHNLWELQISTLVAQHNPTAASQQLEFLAGLNLLPAETVNKLRTMIANPPLDKISDPAVKARVMLDVNSLNPRISEAQIKDYQSTGALSLGDATTALEKRTSVTRALTNQDKANDVRRHTQAEQNLQSILHINPGTLNMMTNIDGDPRTRLYGQLLSELVSRSKAFDGTEDPIEVVEKMRPRIRDAFSSTDGFALTNDEVDKLYPDPQSLERAYRTNRIDQKAYEEAIKRQDEQQKQKQGAPKVDLPRLAPVTPTTQRRSRTYGNQ